MAEQMTSTFFEELMPHGFCYQWDPRILFVNVASDALIALAYFSIPIILLNLLRKRTDIAFRKIFFLFSAFILLCGLTHAFAIYTTWFGAYGMQGLMKLATAIVSVATAIVLYRSMPLILAVPTPTQLLEAQEDAANERLERVRLENERRSAAMFRLAANSLPMGLAVIGRDGFLKMANRTVENITGYSFSELEEKSLSMLLDMEAFRLNANVPEDGEAVEGPPKSDAISGDVTEEKRVGQTVAKRKDGHEVLLEVTLHQTVIEGEPLVVASMLPMETKEGKNLTLYQDANSMRRALTAVNDCVWEYWVGADEFWGNQQFMDFLGLQSGAKANAALLMDLIHPSDRKQIEAIFSTSSQIGKHFDIRFRRRGTSRPEFTWWRLKGRTFRVDDTRSMTGGPLVDQGAIASSENKPRANDTLIAGTLTNIDQIQNLMTALKTEKTFVMNVFEGTVAAHLVYDLGRGSIKLANAAFTKVTGYSASDAQDLIANAATSLSFIHPNDRSAAAKHIRELLKAETGTVSDLLCRVLHAKGHWIWCIAKNSVLTSDAKTKAQELLITFLDITDLKKAEGLLEEKTKQLARTNEDLRHFALLASHDLKVPLRKIQSFVDIFVEEAGDSINEEQRRCVEVITRSSRRMSEMIENILNLASVELRLEELRETFDLGKAVRDAASNLEERFKELGAELKLPKTFPEVHGARVLLMQLFQNLFDNAVKYRDQTRPLSVDVVLRESAETIAIEVSDNGIGFPQSQADYIFQPFSRLGETTATSGSGIGLALCHRIVEAHNGQIIAHGTPDKGATFTIKLPNKDAATYT